VFNVFIIINSLNIRYHLELDILIVDFHQKIGKICFYPEAVQDKYLRSFINNKASTIQKNPKPATVTVTYIYKMLYILLGIDLTIE